MRSSWIPRLRSVALLLAGLLHLLSIPAEPVVHGWFHAPPDHQPGWMADDSGADGTQLHQELVCVVCQGLNEHARPEAEAVPAATGGAHASPPPVGEPRPSSVTRAQLQARAPPV
jgi:hypothetical protein